VREASDRCEESLHQCCAKLTSTHCCACVRLQEPGSSNLKLVLLPTQGQSFKTVAAGLRSNTCAQCAIVLLLQRQQS
jgi:hypothetical protein